MNKTNYPLQSKKIILITGSSGSLGSAISHGFADNNATLIMHYHRNKEKTEALRASINDAYPNTRADIVQADLSDFDQTNAMVENIIHTYGRIDILVNCVGQAYDNPVFFLSDNDVEKTFSGNFSPVVNTCKSVSSHMIKQASGRIINVSSITGLVGQPMRTLYGAAKGAVIAFTKSIARDLAPHGITVNALAPQVVEGGIADSMKDRIRQLMLENTPCQRACEVEDIVGAALFLASPNASFITGETMNITGGLVTW